MQRHALQSELFGIIPGSAPRLSIVHVAALNYDGFQHFASDRVLADTSVGRIANFLFGDLIPTAVSDELRAGAREGEPIIAALEAGDWIETRPVADSPLLKLLCAEVDREEAEAIALALELNATLLIDDRKGRSLAMRLGVIHIGTLGIISLAKHRGVISAVAPLIADMREAGIYYRLQLIDDFLRAHDEGR